MRYTDKVWGARTHEVQARPVQHDIQNLTGPEREAFIGELILDAQRALREIKPYLDRYLLSNTFTEVSAVFLNTILPRHHRTDSVSNSTKSPSSPLGALYLFKEKIDLLQLLLIDEAVGSIFNTLHEQIDSCIAAMWKTNKRIPLSQAAVSSQVNGTLSEIST